MDLGGVARAHLLRGVECRRRDFVGLLRPFTQRRVQVRAILHHFRVPDKDQPHGRTESARRHASPAHSPRLNGPEMIDDGVCETGLEASPRKFADVGEHFVSRHPRDRL